MIDFEPIKDVPFSGLNVEVTNVNWNCDRAVVDIYCPDKQESIQVFINNEFGSCSLRLLDEVDLSDYWKDTNMAGGWLYKVKSGGWFEIESRRDGFISKNAPNMVEYIILGLDMCVSVITKENINILSLSNGKLQKITT